MSHFMYGENPDLVCKVGQVNVALYKKLVQFYIIVSDT